MGLDSAQVLSKTPREFSILMSAQVERQYDEYERKAVEAIMREAAHRAKRPKAGDLFKRPSDSVAKRKDLSEVKAETERLNNWLATLAPARKEEPYERHTR